MRKEGKIKPVTLMENVFAKMAIMGKNVNQVCVNESFIQNLISVKLFFCYFYYLSYFRMQLF